MSQSKSKHNTNADPLRCCGPWYSPRTFFASTAITACLLAPAAQAQTAPNSCDTAPQSCATLVSTEATAQTRLPNTAVDISLGLTVSKVDLPGTQRALAQKTSSLLKFLRAEGAQRLITTNISFTPDTRSQKNGPDRTVGYTGTSSLTLRITPEKAPDLLGGALANGANTIDSTTFTPTEEEIAAARRELAAEATKTAAAQADSIAKAVSLHVIAIRDVQVNAALVAYPEPRGGFAPMRAMREAAPAPPIQTAAGDQQVSVTVSLTAAAGR